MTLLCSRQTLSQVSAGTMAKQGRSDRVSPLTPGAASPAARMPLARRWIPCTPGVHMHTRAAMNELGGFSSLLVVENI